MLVKQYEVGNFAVFCYLIGDKKFNRGRDVRCHTPPAQIRTRSITSYGSYLG
jgi:hypothetical protein